MNDNILPNAAQFAGSAQAGEEWPPRTASERVEPAMGTVFAVPMDDHNTMKFGIHKCRNGEEPSYNKGFGRTADRPYEERQRKPGDYEAWVGQRPIAVHDLEHLGTTDRGVIMFRRMVRTGIRAVQDGKDPLGLSYKDGAVTPTYSSNTVVRVPPASTPEADRELLLKTGRKIAEGYLKTPPTVVYREQIRSQQ
jgi:hypothetical protein